MGSQGAYAEGRAPRASEVPWPHFCPSQQHIGVTSLLPDPINHQLGVGPCPSPRVSVGGLFHLSIPSPASFQCTGRPCSLESPQSGRQGLVPSWEGSLSLAGPCPPGLRKPITFAFHLELRQPLLRANDAPIDYHKHMRKRSPSLGRSCSLCSSDSDIEAAVGSSTPFLACGVWGDARMSFLRKTSLQDGVVSRVSLPC